LFGIAIDAPLIINNKSGQRECERLVSKEYGSRGASCHTSNLILYPNSESVELSKFLIERGYEHLQNIDRSKFQIECYPHPAIIEIFGLPKRLAYKKGKVLGKKQGQIKLAMFIKALENSKIVL
jgi:predicted RNase H-like nuclease